MQLMLRSLAEEQAHKRVQRPSGKSSGRAQDGGGNGALAPPDAEALSGLSVLVAGEGVPGLGESLQGLSLVGSSKRLRLIWENQVREAVQRYGHCSASVLSDSSSPSATVIRGDGSQVPESPLGPTATSSSSGKATEGTMSESKAGKGVEIRRRASSSWALSSSQSGVLQVKASHCRQCDCIL